MSEAEVEAASGDCGEQDAGAVAQPTAPGPAPCLLDQRLDKRRELVAIDGAARARRAGRSGNGHACTLDTVKLL
jgi:hypothetical protein